MRCKSYVQAMLESERQDAFDAEDRLLLEACARQLSSLFNKE
jgi:putative methionine-R-sulfoxide reductase with GAF domain